MLMRIDVPTVPSILLGIDNGVTKVIIVDVPCNEDYLTQIEELSRFLPNLTVFGVIGKKTEFPEVERVDGSNGLIAATPSSKSTVNVLFADSPTKVWVDDKGKYCDCKSPVGTSGALYPLSSSISLCQSCVCLADSSIEDIAISVKALPVQSHVVRLRYRDIVVERRYDVEPTVSSVRQSYLKAFGAKLQRSDVVCGVALSPQPAFQESEKRSRFVSFAIAGAVALFVAIAVQFY